MPSGNMEDSGYKKQKDDTLSVQCVLWSVLFLSSEISFFSSNVGVFGVKFCVFLHFFLMSFVLCFVCWRLKATHGRQRAEITVLIVKLQVQSVGHTQLACYFWDF